MFELIRKRFKVKQFYVILSIYIVGKVFYLFILCFSCQLFFCSVAKVDSTMFLHITATLLITRANFTYFWIHKDEFDLSYIISRYRYCNRTQAFFIPYPWVALVVNVTRRVPLVGQKLLTIPEHPSSLQVFSVVRVTRSLVSC